MTVATSQDSEGMTCLLGSMHPEKPSPPSAALWNDARSIAVRIHVRTILAALERRPPIFSARSG